MRRLYFMLPNVSTTNTVVNELLLQRINDHHIHVMAKEGTSIGDLPEANLFQKSDFIPAVERGLAIGGITGILAGIAAVTIPSEGMALGGGAILASSLAGSVIGAWISGMIGLDVHNTQIAKFEKTIEAGGVLLMVDVPKGRAQGIKEMVHSHYPEAMIAGSEPQIPAFP